MEREREGLRQEKERVRAAALRIRLRSEEVEKMSQVPRLRWAVAGPGGALSAGRLADPASLQVASEKYQEGEQALREARQVQSEHQARLQLVRQQVERLQQQEQHVQQARPPPAPAFPVWLHRPPTFRPSQLCPSLRGRGQEHLSLAQQRLQLDHVRHDLPFGPVGPLAQAPGLAASGTSGEWPSGGRCQEHPATPPSTQVRGQLALVTSFICLYTVMRVHYRKMHWEIEENF